MTRSSEDKRMLASSREAAVKVLIVGQTPPPFNGQGAMIQQLVNSQLADVQLIHVRMGFSSHMSELGRIRLSKILHLFGLIARIFHRRFKDGVRILYYPPGGPFRVPMFRDIAVLLSTRWLFDKTIFHFHSGGVSDLYDRLPAWQRWLFRRAYFGADAAIRLSELNPEDGRRMAAKREFVIPNGIDDPCPDLLVSPSNSAATRDDRLHILFVGILSELKGLLVLIEACGKLAARGVPFELELMGQWESEELAARTRKRIKELNLDKQVRFLGMLTGNEKFAAFCRANVFCFPTFLKCEALPIVVLEAMACGMPVVATRWRGIPSAVDEGQTGFLVEPHDPEAVADRLARLADDARLRECMGRAGRAKFEHEFTFPRHASRMRRVLLEVAGMAVDEELEVDGDSHVQHASAANAADYRCEARAETATA